jgi:hypothetical protein
VYEVCCGAVQAGLGLELNALLTGAKDRSVWKLPVALGDELSTAAQIIRTVTNEHQGLKSHSLYISSHLPYQSPKMLHQISKRHTLARNCAAKVWAESWVAVCETAWQVAGTCILLCRHWIKKISLIWSCHVCSSTRSYKGKKSRNKSTNLSNQLTSNR